MSLLVLVRWVIILTCSLTIVLPCTQWIERENYRTGAVSKCCSISCSPGFYVVVCTSNGTSDKCVPCPEGTYMEDPTNSFLPQPCIPHECPPNSVPTDSFPLAGCQKKCRCDVTKGFEGPDPCNCQYKSTILPGKTPHSGKTKDSNTSNTNRNLREETKNNILQINTDGFLNNTIREDKIYLNVNHETVLWITGGIIMALVLGVIIIAVCCLRGKCKRKTLDPIFTTLSCPYQEPSNTERPRSSRPEARVFPFRNEVAVSNNERSQPLLSGDAINTYSVSQSGEDRPSGQTNLHAINEQGNHSFGLDSASTLNPTTIHEDQTEWNSFDENIDVNIRVEDQFQSSNYMNEHTTFI